MTNIPIERSSFQDLLQNKTTEVASEPEYSWQRDFNSFMQDGDGNPVVRIAVTNFSPDLDIWGSLRTPAHVGRFPLQPSDIWEHYAASSFKKVRSDGTRSILALPETFTQARERIGRVVLVCGMLAVNPAIYEQYAAKIERGDQDPFDYYNRAVKEVDGIIDKSVNKLALSLMTPHRAVVPMTDRNSQCIVERTRGEYRKDQYHGPCNDHWPQNSIAVMTGLMRFGIHRLAFRDEVDTAGKRQRLFGRYRSIVIFDPAEPIADDAAGVTMLDRDHLAWLTEINNYTNCAPDVVAQRYCTYNMTKGDGNSICGQCIGRCPSDALANSSPAPDGVYAKAVTRQKHRFLEETLVFDFGNCISDRYQKAELFEEYVCARCEAICAARGVRKSASKINYINRKE